MSEPTPEQIAKLPKWARERIESLTREVATWKESALRFAKEQPPSPFYIDHGFSETCRQYIATPERRISVRHAGVDCDIFLARKDDTQRYFGVEITFSETDHRGQVAIVPRVSNVIQLVHKDNLR